MTARGRWVVRCDNFTTPTYRTKEQAEARKAGIENMGNCDLDHEVIELPPTTTTKGTS